MKDEYLLMMMGKQFQRDGVDCSDAVELFMKSVKQREIQNEKHSIKT